MWIRASLLWLLLSLLATAGAEPVLPDCPDSPNCVSSQASDPDKRVAPLPGAGSPGESLALLLEVLDGLPRVSREVGPEGRLVHAVFRTRLLGFRDDVDFAIRDDGRIAVRSASRTGYWDLGTNRRRVEKLRERLRQALDARS